MNRTLELLFEEISRLGERFADNEDALEALQAVQNWAIEESVENVNAPLSDTELLLRWNEVKSGQGVILTQEEFESQCI